MGEDAMKIFNKITCQNCLWILITALIMTLCPISGCEKKEPIKVGFVGGLTGRHYELGVSGRNGAMLAVEEANEKGGIRGRQIELIVRNDMQDPEVAVRVDKELIEQGVIAIVGHMTSQMSMASLPMINEKKVVMVSPTVASPLFDGIDDYFIKLSPSLKNESLHLADYAFNNMKLRKISVVNDLSNKAYTAEWHLIFKSRFEGLGGRIISAISFNSNEETSFTKITRKLTASNPDGILIIASAFDTAAICQQIRKINTNPSVLSSAWGMTTDILRHGGIAVENVVFSHISNPADNSPEYLAFKKKYIERFGREPDFAAVKSYDAVNVILSAIHDSKDITDMKSAILKKRVFKGVQGDFEIDGYGDVKSKPFLITIRESKFVPIK